MFFKLCPISITIMVQIIDQDDITNNEIGEILTFLKPNANPPQKPSILTATASNIKLKILIVITSLLLSII
jgi:hypothetical protein